MPRIRTCRGCGCTDAQACPGGCWWVAPGVDLCSTCDPRIMVTFGETPTKIFVGHSRPAASFGRSTPIAAMTSYPYTPAGVRRALGFLAEGL